MLTPHIHCSTPTPETGFEWEELPSLGGVVLRRHVPHGSYEIAAEMVDPLTPSEPLADTRIDGLAAREIIEPDAFRHFFGRPSYK
jgi:hypothetical protein